MKLNKIVVSQFAFPQTVVLPHYVRNRRSFPLRSFDDVVQDVYLHFDRLSKRQSTSDRTNLRLSIENSMDRWRKNFWEPRIPLSSSQSSCLYHTGVVTNVREGHKRPISFPLRNRSSKIIDREISHKLKVSVEIWAKKIRRSTSRNRRSCWRRRCKMSNRNHFK